MSLFHKPKCPSCGSYIHKKLKDIMGLNFEYYKCQRCSHIWFEQKDWKKEKEEPKGDNYPLLPNYSKIAKLRREREELVKELFKHGYKKITRDEVIDMAIELGLYNQRCKKRRKKGKK